jgi:hypothetical protein
MGIVAGLVTKSDQTAAEIVHEISSEAEALLKGSRNYVEATAQL